MAEKTDTPDQSFMDKIRDYMMSHGGLGGADNKQYDLALNVEPSTGTAKGYAMGGMVMPDLGSVPMPNEPPPPVSRGTSPIQGILSQSQGLGAQMAGQYTPDMRNQLYASLLERQNSLPNAIGGGLASVGDAITRGYGRSNSDFLDKTIQGQKDTTQSGLGAFDTAQKMNLQQTQTGMELGKMDPTSEISKSAQAAFSGPLSKLGYDPEAIAKMPASQIDTITQVALKYADIESQKELKEATIQLQAMMGNATIRNQTAEREQARKNAEEAARNAGLARQQDAAKSLAGRGIWRRTADFVTQNPATKVLEKQAAGEDTNFAPDVTSYAQKHGISNEEAQSIKNKRTGGQ